MSCSEERGCGCLLLAFLTVWLVSMTASCAEYKRAQRSEDELAQFLQSSNLSRDELLDDLVKRLVDRLKFGSNSRVRRSNPTSLSSASSSTLLFNLLDNLIQDSLGNVCRSADKVCLPGPKGQKGEQGQAGWPGYKGENGSPGVAGGQGVAGKQGPRGVQGMEGVKGDVGVGGKKGDTGMKGDQGIKGERGVVGEKGFRGDKGDLGLPGYKGEKGVKGTTGLRGVIGEKGGVGGKGQKGDKGLQMKSLSSLLPSECSNYDVLDEPWRKVSNVHRYNPKGVKCDGSGFAGWKRFADSIGGKMAENCPKTSACGTNFPGWVKDGAHPTIVGQTTTVKICFLARISGCCPDGKMQVSAEVTNCGFYYVYNLPRTPGCYLGYCSSG